MKKQEQLLHKPTTDYSDVLLRIDSVNMIRGSLLRMFTVLFILLLERYSGAQMVCDNDLDEIYCVETDKIYGYMKDSRRYSDFINLVSELRTNNIVFNAYLNTIDGKVYCDRGKLLYLFSGLENPYKYIKSLICMHKHVALELVRNYFRADDTKYLIGILDDIRFFKGLLSLNLTHNSIRQLLARYFRLVLPERCNIEEEYELVKGGGSIVDIFISCSSNEAIVLDVKVTERTETSSKSISHQVGEYIQALTSLGFEVGSVVLVYTSRHVPIDIVRRLTALNKELINATIKAQVLDKFVLEYLIKKYKDYSNCTRGCIHKLLHDIASNKVDTLRITSIYLDKRIM